MYASFKLQAYALILLRGPGHPFVFAVGFGSKPTNERFFFSCVFYGDLYPNDECYDEQTAQGLRLLMRARKDFAYGPSRDYFDHPSCIGFVRMGDTAHDGCVVVISHGTQKPRFVLKAKHSKIQFSQHCINRNGQRAIRVKVAEVGNSLIDHRSEF